MSKRGAIIPLILMLIITALCPLAESGSRASNQTALADAPQLSGLQILFRGQPVNHLITGERAKHYTFNLTGSGFDLDSRVVIKGRKVPTTFVSSTELTAKLRGGVVPPPGELAIEVLNPDGQSSNVLTADVISNPEVLSIQAFSPAFGLIGSQAKLTGNGFTATGNRLHFRKAANLEIDGFTVELPSADGKTITFAVPITVCPPCSPECLLPCFGVSPGEYQVSVTNANGISNNVSFL